METQSEIPLYSEPPGGFKRRRLQNACDHCRQKKVRCDSAQRPGNICSNCMSFNLQCTHLMSAKKKGNAPVGGPIPAQPAEGGPDFARKQIGAILSSSTPYLLPDDPATIRKVLKEIAAYAHSLEELVAARRSKSPSSTDNNSTPRPVYSSEDSKSKGKDYVDLVILDPFGRLDIHGSKNNFYGKSSQMALLKEAFDLKKQHSSVEGRGLKRMAFWSIHPWQKFDSSILRPLEFPDPDLLVTLVELYFTRYNLFLPLLHRPSFERSLKQHLHLQDRCFGELVLAICAIGARYSKDPRVHWRGSESEHSVGWQYFGQIHPFRPSLSVQPSIYEVQLICASVVFLQATSTPDACWSLLSLGVRYAQGVGAHRRGFNGNKATVQNELWKRAFWVLVGVDVYMSAFLGRPRAAHPADYDLDLPIACDDEYWEHPDPEQAFRQPPGRPSYMEAWVTHLKLLGILGFAQHHMFAVKRVEQWANITDDTWDEKVAIELDSALNKWVDEVPDHLRWNPHREDLLFFEQSSCLYSTYYWIQIQIHRPFISAAASENRITGMSYSSLAVCANAARSCSHVLDIHSRRGYAPLPNIFIALFNSAIVLLFNLWGGRRAGVSLDAAREIGDVYKCVNALHMYEDQWQIAGRFSDIIAELVSVSDTTHPATATSAGTHPDLLKRGREDDVYVSTASPGLQEATTTSSSVLSQQLPQFPSVSGTGSTNSPSQTLESSVPSPSSAIFILPDISRLFGLPLYTEDLGRLPIHFPENGMQQTLETPLPQGSSPGYPSNDSASLFQQSFNDSSADVGSESHAQQGYDLYTSSNEPASAALRPDCNAYVQGVWAAAGGDRWDDWDSYMSTVDDLLFAMINTTDASLPQA